MDEPPSKAVSLCFNLHASVYAFLNLVVKILRFTVKVARSEFISETLLENLSFLSKYRAFFVRC